MKFHWIDSGYSGDGFDWTGSDTIDRNGRALESVIDAPNFKKIWWLESALDAARHVCRVKLPMGSATGFLIADDILMTNNHVFENENDARNAKLEFNYRALADGTQAPIDIWECDPDKLFKTNSNLDYSIVKVKKKGNANVGVKWGFFDLRNNQIPQNNQRVNIIQHPQGKASGDCF